MAALEGIQLEGPPKFLTTTLSPVSSGSSSQDTRISLYEHHSHVDSTTPTPASPDPSRPFVTLTFAQSLDAKIAGKAGKQLILSGKESMVMTHW